MEQQHHTAINWMDRKQVIDLLQEQAGIACFEHESTDALRDALRENIIDGTIPADLLYN